MRGAASTRAWLFWGGSAVAAGALAFVAGASGLLGHAERAPEPPAVVQAPVEGANLLDCPAGRTVAVAAREERLYVVGRTADAQWLAVRAPELGYRTVWVAALPVVADEFPTAIADLPVRECAPPEVRR